MYQGFLRKVKKYFQTRLFINFLANSPRLEYPVVSVFHGAISPRLINENFVVPSSCLWDFQDPDLVLTGGAQGGGSPPGTHAAGLGTKTTDRQPFKIHFLASVFERNCPETHFLKFQLQSTIAVTKTSCMFILVAVLKRIYSSRHFGILHFRQKK